MKKKIEETVATGRRKTAVASVRVRPGKGTITVNKREFDKYFPLPVQREKIVSPLAKFELESSYDILVRVRGGGIEAQVVAARLAIARALVASSEDRRQDLKVLGYLTRDPRKKERKKYGLAGARKSFQFSKR